MAAAYLAAAMAELIAAQWRQIIGVDTVSVIVANHNGEHAAGTLFISGPFCLFIGFRFPS